MKTIVDFLDQELRTALNKDSDLFFIREILKKYKEHGIPSSEVNLLLEDIRSEITDETIEDKVLEVMDIVSGFCSPHMKIW